MAHSLAHAEKVRALFASVTSRTNEVQSAANDVIERVTIDAARSISIDDRAGSLRSGAPADITVFRIEDGEFELADCQLVTRTAEQRFVPVMAFKNGVRYDSDMERCRDERNWFWQLAEDAVPAAAGALDGSQRRFLGALAAELEGHDWRIESAERLDIFAATELQDRFHKIRAECGLGLGDALYAVYNSFLDNPFTMQIGLFLFRLDKAFAVERMRRVAESTRDAAA